MSTYTAEMAHAAVARGAAWLDKKCPDWPNEIDVQTLNLGSPSHCILGQTADCILGPQGTTTQPTDGFGRVMSRIAKDRPIWAERRGFLSFLAPDRQNRRETFVTYEMLTIAWKELIRQRLEAV